MRKALDTPLMSWASLALTLTVAACGHQPRTNSAKLLNSQAAAPAVYSYDAWCAAWSLNCPPAEANDPSKNLTPAHWKSLLKIGNSIGQGATAVDLTAADLSDDTLKQAAQVFGFDAAWTALQNRINSSKFSSLHLGSGAAVVNTAAPTTSTGPSALVQNLSTKLTLTVTPDLQLGISGLTLASPKVGQDTPHTIDVAEAGLFTWVGDTTTVSAVPTKFLSGETLGSNVPTPTTPKPAYKDVEALVAPLAAWFSSRDGINIDLAQAPLQVIATEIPGFITDPDAAAAVTTVLQKISSVHSTATSRPQYLFEATIRDGVTCVFNNQAQLQLAEHVALTAVKTLDDGSVSLTFDGIKAILGTGVLTLPADITRIDLTPTSIILQDLPIIGSYTINIGDSSPAPAKVTFTCS